MSLTLLLRVVLLLSLLSQYLYSGCRDAIIYIVVYGATRVRGSVGNLDALMGRNALMGRDALMGRGALNGRSGPMAPSCAALWARCGGARLCGWAAIVAAPKSDACVP